MDLHDLKPGDMIINSVGEEAIVEDTIFFEKDVRIILNRGVTGWLENSTSKSWCYYYNGKFFKLPGDTDKSADIVKVIKHD